MIKRLAVAFSLCGIPAMAHDAPTGWSYPFACCSNQDCREVADAEIKETPSGYVYVITGETIPYADKRIKDSPDGHFHICTVAGEEKGRVLCLFRPPRGF